jgi:uncharacterized membrane protein
MNYDALKWVLIILGWVLLIMSWVTGIEYFAIIAVIFFGFSVAIGIGRLFDD